MLEGFRKQEEDRWFGVLQGRATVTLDREKKAAKESYDYRIKELQERTREREIGQLAKELVKQRAESNHRRLCGRCRPYFLCRLWCFCWLWLLRFLCQPFRLSWLCGRC